MSSNETPPEPSIDEVVEKAVREAEKEMRKVFGDQFVDGQLRLAEQRRAFKTDLTNAVEGGKSGRQMAEFLNGHAWLWTYVYRDVERDPQYKAMIERALSQCAPRWRRWFRISAATHHVPEDWHRAVKLVDERTENTLRRYRKSFLEKDNIEIDAVPVKFLDPSDQFPYITSPWLDKTHDWSRPFVAFFLAMAIYLVVMRILAWVITGFA